MMDLVDRVNNANLSWTARYNKFGKRSEDLDDTEYLIDYDVAYEYVKLFRGYHKSDRMKQHAQELSQFDETDLPYAFDAREKWPYCPSIGTIPNQGGCGGCYAVASMGVASDRACIGSNGTIRSILSAADVIGCLKASYGCFGGEELYAFVYWVKEGVVTGDRDGCRPYKFDLSCGTPCSMQHFKHGQANNSCLQECQNIYTNNDYKSDKVYGSIAYSLYPQTVNLKGRWEVMLPAVSDYLNVTNDKQLLVLLKKELFLYGPFTVAMYVYEDFLHYASGIYEHYGTDAKIYLHVVRVIGWGKENGKEYFLCANSFGAHWGDNGFFKIDLLKSALRDYDAALL